MGLLKLSLNLAKVRKVNTITGYTIMGDYLDQETHNFDEVVLETAGAHKSDGESTTRILAQGTAKPVRNPDKNRLPTALSSDSTIHRIGDRRPFTTRAVDAIQQDL